MRAIVTTLSSLVLAQAKETVFSSSCPQSTSKLRVNSIPYFEGDDLPCSYAGNMRSSSKYDNHYFFWLFPKPATSEDESNGTENPLIIYMNGGPGSTSMNALFTENGPLRVAQPGGSSDYSNFEVTYEPDSSW